MLGGTVEMTGAPATTVMAQIAVVVSLSSTLNLVAVLWVSFTGVSPTPEESRSTLSVITSAVPTGGGPRVVTNVTSVTEAKDTWQTPAS